MAWYRCGGGSGKDRPIYKTLKLHSGKISNTTGEVVEDNTFYYTDYFPCPNGEFTFDMGYTSNSETYAGVTMYKEDKSYTSNWYWNPTQRYRNRDVSSYYSQGARFLRFSFPADKFQYVMLHDWANGVMYSTEEVVKITDDEDVPLGTKTITENGTYSAQDDGLLGYSEVTVDTREYVDLTSFAFYFNRNTTTPTITSISSDEVSLTFQDQNATHYEMCSFSVSLTKGVYIAEIYATVDMNTGITSQYTWGIYSCNSAAGAKANNSDPRIVSWTTYVPIDRADTNEHYYKVPINVTADGMAYVCFTMGDDNNTNATVTVRSLKIRKV